MRSNVSSRICRAGYRGRVRDRRARHPRGRSGNRPFEVSNEYAPEHLIMCPHRVAGFRGCVTPDRSSSADIRRSHWATTAAAPTTSCRPAAMHAPAAAWACPTSSSASPSRRPVRTACALGPVAITLARMEGLEAHARAVSVRLSALDAESAHERRAPSRAARHPRAAALPACGVEPDARTPARQRDALARDG